MGDALVVGIGVEKPWLERGDITVLDTVLDTVRPLTFLRPKHVQL